MDLDILMVCVSFACRKRRLIMKLLNFDFGKNGKVSAGDKFSVLCQMMMDAPSFGWSADASLDNEFYAHFGMSASEVLSQLRAQKREACNQKHSSTY